MNHRVINLEYNKWKVRMEPVKNLRTVIKMKEIEFVKLRNKKFYNKTTHVYFLSWENPTTYHFYCKKSIWHGKKARKIGQFDFCLLPKQKMFSNKTIWQVWGSCFINYFWSFGQKYASKIALTRKTNTHEIISCLFFISVFDIIIEF